MIINVRLTKSDIDLINKTIDSQIFQCQKGIDYFNNRNPNQFPTTDATTNHIDWLNKKLKKLISLKEKLKYENENV
jgi:hypothetical protein